MKAELKFDLSDFDDTLDFKRCVKSTDMAIALFEIQNNLRRRVEAAIDCGILTTPQQTLDYTIQLIVGDIGGQHIDIDDLII